MTSYELTHFREMVWVWKTKSLLFCLRYDTLIVSRKQNHITFIFIKKNVTWPLSANGLFLISLYHSGAPNGSVPQNICSSGTFLLAGRCERNNSPWKESVAGKKIIQGVRGDLKSRIAATGYLYGLLTTQDLNCALWNFPVSQVAGCKVAGWELFHQSCWEWGTDNFFSSNLPKCLK